MRIICLFFAFFRNRKSKKFINSERKEIGNFSFFITLKKTNKRRERERKISSSFLAQRLEDLSSCSYFIVVDVIAVVIVVSVVVNVVVADFWLKSRPGKEKKK